MPNDTLRSDPQLFVPYEVNIQLIEHSETRLSPRRCRADNGNKTLEGDPAARQQYLGSPVLHDHLDHLIVPTFECSKSFISACVSRSSGWYKWYQFDINQSIYETIYPIQHSIKILHCSVASKSLRKAIASHIMLKPWENQSVHLYCHVTIHDQLVSRHMPCIRPVLEAQPEKFLKIPWYRDCRFEWR